MANLPKRQVIILSLMMLSVLYGMYELFLSPKKLLTYGEAKKPLDVTALIAEINTNLSKTALTEFETQTIKHMKAEWTNDPFYEQKLDKETAKSKETDKSTDRLMPINNLNYTGYLELGKKKMAIINGMEYGTGEPLDIEGYVVRSINPAKVVIQNKTDKTEFEVRIQE